MHHDIVIVGGGAGGLELAARLGRRLGKKTGPERVLLIDKSVYHIWKPSLHEIAAGTLDAHQEGLSYPVLGRRNHFSFALGELGAFDPAAKRLTLKPIVEDGLELAPERTISFTYGVLAIGSGTNLFGTPGAEKALRLEDTADAERFHGRLLAAFTKASFAAERVMRVAILDENRAVGALMGGLGGPNFFIEGLVAKWMYMSLHLDHHRAILGVGKTVVLAMARLLQQRVSGRLKLH